MLILLISPFLMLPTSQLIAVFNKALVRRIRGQDIVLFIVSGRTDFNILPDIAQTTEIVVHDFGPAPQHAATGQMVGCA